MVERTLASQHASETPPALVLTFAYESLVSFAALGEGPANKA